MRFELTILGTASQSPTRARGQGGYALRWGDELIAFDPGEGCQRQLLLAGLSPARVDRICITHFHGDHCLGLPGLVQSRALATDRPVELHYPAAGEVFVDRLLSSSVIDFDLRVVRRPLEPGDTLAARQFDISAESLEHPTPTIGYRLEAGPSTHLVTDLLDAAGLDGDAIHELDDTGAVEVDGRTVTAAEVSERRAGPAAAFVMDTAPCDGARRLAAGVDLLVCEATYRSSEADLAAARGHMTAAQAGMLAADAGAGLLVLSHFSNRYTDVEELAAEARRHTASVVAAHDLSCIPWLAPSHPLPGPGT